MTRLSSTCCSNGNYASKSNIREFECTLTLNKCYLENFNKLSIEDRDRWNHRYRTGAYRSRRYASRLLTDWSLKLPRGRALDLACGAGRNTLYLANTGYEVTAVDISDVAIDQARNKQSASPEIDFVVHDLEIGYTPTGKYDLIVMVRYVNLRLLGQMAEWLTDHGVIVTEQHLAIETDRPLSGPTNPKFRVQPGALKTTVAQLDVIHEFEGFITDPSGDESAVSQLIVCNR